MIKFGLTPLVDSSKSGVTWNEPEGFHVSSGAQANLQIRTFNCYSVGGDNTNVVPEVMLQLNVTAKTDGSEGFMILHLTSRSARQLARGLEAAANDFDAAIPEL